MLANSDNGALLMFERANYIASNLTPPKKVDINLKTSIKS